MCESCFNFLNSLIPFFSKEQFALNSKEHKFIKIEAPFADKISGLAIVKMLNKKEQSTVMLKLKFVRNRVVLDITNNTLETVIFDLKEMIDILYLRSLGYYKIKQGVLQQKLSKYYHFESKDIICGYYNKFVNALKKGKGRNKRKNTHD